MLTALLLFSLAQPAGVVITAPWEKVSSDDGLLLEQRAVPISSSPEFRVTVVTKTPLEALCEVVFEWGTRGKDLPGLIARQEISSIPDERTIYDQFDAPLVSNRDYAITVRRTRTPDRVCQVKYWLANDKAPKKLDGWVRIDKLWGSWTLTPKDGATQLVYVQFSDPGGSVPAMFAIGAQRDKAVQSVKMALEKGKAAQK